MRFNIDKRSFIKNALFYLVFIGVGLCIRSSVFASYVVPTPSMNPTVLEGDFFITNKLAYRLKVPFTKTTVVDLEKPKRGDIIVFKFPLDESELYMKRVIAVPGDIVEVKNGKLMINGREVEQRLLSSGQSADLYKEDLFGSEYTIQHLKSRTRMESMPPVVVPEGYLFVEGDNRDDSYDSRYWGLLAQENVEGKVVARWFSFDTKKLKPRFDRIGLM